MSIPVIVTPPALPAKARAALYWASYVLGSLAGLVSGSWLIIAAASPDVTAPLVVQVGPPIILLLVSQLNGLAGLNVRDPETVQIDAPQGSEVSATVDTPGTDDGMRLERDQHGAADVHLALLVIAVVLLVLIVAVLASQPGPLIKLG